MKRPHPCHGDVSAEYLDAPVRPAVVGSRTFNDYTLLEGRLRDPIVPA